MNLLLTTADDPIASGLIEKKVTKAVFILLNFFTKNLINLIYNLILKYDINL